LYKNLLNLLILFNSKENYSKDLELVNSIKYIYSENVILVN